DDERGGSAIAPLEVRGNRLEQPAEHERERLEPLDRPLEIQVRFKPFVWQHRDERPVVFAAGQPLQPRAISAEAGGDLGTRQRGERPERGDAPAGERVDEAFVPIERLARGATEGCAWTPPRREPAPGDL